MTYFNIWRGGPPGRRTNRLTWHMPSCQMVQSAAGNRTDIWNFLCKQTAYFSWWIILNTTAYIQARASFATRYTAATQYVNMYVRRTRNIAVAFRRPLAENFTLRRTRIGKKTTTKKTFSLQDVCFVYQPIQFWVDCVQFFFLYNICGFCVCMLGQLLVQCPSALSILSAFVCLITHILLQGGPKIGTFCTPYNL